MDIPSGLSAPLNSDYAAVACALWLLPERRYLLDVTVCLEFVTVFHFIAAHLLTMMRSCLRELEHSSILYKIRTS